MARVTANVDLVTGEEDKVMYEMPMVIYEDFNLIVPKKGLKAIL